MWIGIGLSEEEHVENVLNKINGYAVLLGRSKCLWRNIADLLCETYKFLYFDQKTALPYQGGHTPVK